MHVRLGPRTVFRAVAKTVSYFLSIVEERPGEEPVVTPEDARAPDPKVMRSHRQAALENTP
jgi:hypothetical protein